MRTDETAPFRVEQAQHDALVKMAEGTAHDIAGDFPEMDVAYDLYIEDLGGTVWGVIDMGDAWQATFTWINGEWERNSADAYDVTERILRKRGFR